MPLTFNFAILGATSAPVSYTHLDVYKRQGLGAPPMLVRLGGLHCFAVLRIDVYKRQV